MKPEDKAKLLDDLDTNKFAAAIRKLPPKKSAIVYESAFVAGPPRPEV